jgi:hypothetical protein
MIRRMVNTTASHWRPLAFGGALSFACTLLLVVKAQRARERMYADWWERRARLRAESHVGQPELFV